jgi:hypothetical protein
MADEPAAFAPAQTITGADAPFIYFEEARFFGVIGGVGKIALSATRQKGGTPDGNVLFDHVFVGHLVGNLGAVRSLRAALDGILLLAEPKPEGPAN